MLIEKINAIFPLCHRIFFQPFSIFSWNVHIGHAVPGIVCFQYFDRHLSLLQQFADEDRDQILCFQRITRYFFLEELFETFFQHIQEIRSHLNNFNYQLTPSIILEIVKWRKETGRDCKIIFTAHDYQLVCPNHMLNNPNTHQNCEKCLGGHFVNCMKGKCIHGSTAKSAIGMMEAEFWKWKGTYKYIDTMICCSEFMKSKMDSNPLFATKTVAMHNFIDKVEWKETEKKDYVLYFGRFSEEKGIGTLIKVCKELPDVQFIFAGTGPLEETVNGIKNIKNVGFQKGEALEKLIREARFSIYPSEWYENCPFSVMESQMYGTPVLGANIGGIPELIQVGKNGELFESGNAEDLKKKIEKLWGDKKLCAEYSANCKDISFDTIDEYYEKIMKVYQ